MAQPWRSIKRQARRVVHTTMQVPAIVIDAQSQEWAVSVRYHDGRGLVGDLAGTNLSYAETREVHPSLIFWRYQFDPKRAMTVSLETGEAYRIDNVEPPDDTTVKAFVVPLDSDDAAGLPIPDGAGSYDFPLPTTWYPDSPTSLSEIDEFLPIPDLLDEDDTYFYMGWESVAGDWLIRRKERSTTVYLDGSSANNPSYANLTAAWPDRASLSYA